MKDKIMAFIMLVIVCLPMIIGLIILGVWIYAMVVYGDTPISEAPVWVYWIFTTGRK